MYVINSPIGVRVFTSVLEVSGTITAKKASGSFGMKKITEPQSELKTLVNVSSIYFLRFQRGVARTIISYTKVLVVIMQIVVLFHNFYLQTR